MAAVIAAIGAAFLAGAVALFREHRLQQRRLLIAARVTFSTFGLASHAIDTSLKSNGWAPFNAMPGDDAFASAWETCKEDLAGHLTWAQWRKVELAVGTYLVARSMSRDDPPQESREVLDIAKATLEHAGDVLRPYCIQRLSVWNLIQRKAQQVKDRKQRRATSI